MIVRSRNARVWHKTYVPLSVFHRTRTISTFDCFWESILTTFNTLGPKVQCEVLSSLGIRHRLLTLYIVIFYILIFSETLGLLELSLVGMFIGWSSCKGLCLFFVIGNTPPKKTRGPKVSKNCSLLLIFCENTGPIRIKLNMNVHLMVIEIIFHPLGRLAGFPARVIIL